MIIVNLVDKLIKLRETRPMVGSFTIVSSVFVVTVAGLLVIHSMDFTEHSNYVATLIWSSLVFCLCVAISILAWFRKNKYPKPNSE